MEDYKNDILDQETPSTSKCANWSFVIFIISFAFYAFSLFFLLSTIVSIATLFILAIPLTLNIIGLLQAVRSYRLKEVSVWKRNLGFIGNLILIILPLIALAVMLTN